MAVKKNGHTIPEMISTDLQMIGYQQITGLDTLKSLTLPTDFVPVEAMIQATGQAVRWRADGVDPTDSVGMRLADGDTMYLRGQAAIASFKALEESATAVLNVSYWA